MNATITGPVLHTHQPEPPFHVHTHLCVRTDQEKLLPKRRRAPSYLPQGIPLPRAGEVVYLSSSSAWVVTMVIHSWLSPRELRIEVWLEHVGQGQNPRHPDFMSTQ